MEKNRTILLIIIGLICLILTALIFVQFKTIKQTDITSIETMREEELETEIAKYKTKYEEVVSQKEETNAMIKEYEDTINTEKAVSELLEVELEKYNNLLGKNDVTGEGVVITLTDSENHKIEAYDLMQLVNELKEAGAEAISINDQRIVYDSYIVDINYTYISINGKRTVSPYVVKAIGDETYLESGLSQKQYGYIDTKKIEQKLVTLDRKDNLTIKKHENNLNFEYIKGEE